jgi:hypothetical protein
MRWLLVLLAATACKKPPEPPPSSDMPVMPAAEIQRGRDACKAYVDKVCACAQTVAAMQQPCSLARALPDALQLNLDVAASPDTTRRDALQSHDSARKVIKECIEATARLPASGCP